MTTVSKSQFARLSNVGKSRVTSWLTEGKIDGAAIVGEGRFARIDVDLARVQLKARLSTNESHGLNGLWTDLGDDAPEVSLADRLKALKVREAEYKVDRLEAEERLEDGTLMRTTGAQKGYHQVGSDLMTFFEGTIRVFADAMARDHGVPQKDAMITLRREYMAARADAAALHKKIAAGLDPLDYEDF
jgi:hypothetical protein